MTVMENSADSCWVCNSDNLALKREGVSAASLTPENFRITDAGYGVTGELYQCGDCGFQFCGVHLQHRQR